MVLFKYKHFQGNRLPYFYPVYCGFLMLLQLNFSSKRLPKIIILINYKEMKIYKYSGKKVHPIVSSALLF